MASLSLAISVFCGGLTLMTWPFSTSGSACRFSVMLLSRMPSVTSSCLAVTWSLPTMSLGMLSSSPLPPGLPPEKIMYIATIAPTASTPTMLQSAIVRPRPSGTSGSA